MDDIKRIFVDFEVSRLVRDPEAPGAFLKARKPSDWNPCDLRDIELYSMVLGRRTKDIPDLLMMPFSRKLKIFIVSNILPKLRSLGLYLLNKSF